MDYVYSIEMIPISVEIQISFQNDLVKRILNKYIVFLV